MEPSYSSQDKKFLVEVLQKQYTDQKAIAKKGVPNTIICPMCEIDIEHMLHIFFDCSFATQCWQQTGLTFDMGAVESAPGWLLNKLTVENSDNMIKIAIVLWVIWFVRNWKVWENKSITPAVAVELSSKQFTEWQEAIRRKQENIIMTCKGHQVSKAKWERPERGWKKLNVDASVFAGVSYFTLGMVLRDEGGQFVQGKNMRVHGNATVLEAEASGVLEALQEIGVQNVIIESDSQLIVSALQQNKDYRLEEGRVFECCQELLQCRTDLVIRHFKKQANRLGRASRMHSYT